MKCNQNLNLRLKIIRVCQRISKYFERFLCTFYKAIPWTASKDCGQYSYQQHSRSKDCMPKAKKFNILRPYIQGLLQKIKIYVQMLSLIFLVSYLLLELEFPKNIEERKVLLEVHFIESEQKFYKTYFTKAYINCDLSFIYQDS